MEADVLAILFSIPLRLMDLYNDLYNLYMTTTSLKTSPGVSWRRGLLSARLLPGHNCSHWRNQELSPAWETDHIVFESNVFPLWRTKAIVANYKLSSYRSSEVARIRFSWIHCYSYIVSLHFFVSSWNEIIPIRTFCKKFVDFATHICFGQKAVGI